MSPFRVEYGVLLIAAALIAFLVWPFVAPSSGGSKYERIDEANRDLLHDLPIYEGSRALPDYQRFRRDEPRTYTAGGVRYLFDEYWVLADPGDVLEFYRERLLEEGWVLEDDSTSTDSRRLAFVRAGGIEMAISVFGSDVRTEAAIASGGTPLHLTTYALTVGQPSE